jgi:polysaccharide chain length determinant protein (PEP-CTERM system associated)
MDILGSQIEYLKGELRSAWRFRWRALTVAWVVAATGWVVTTLLPDVYEARTRVYVETATQLRPLLQGLAVESNVEGQIDLVRQALLSEPNLNKVAESNGLLQGAKSATDIQDRILKLRDEINLAVQMNRSTGNYTYTVSYRNEHRERALNVVKMLLASFSRDIVDVQRTGQESAQKFLREQIGSYEQRLREAEDRLAEFKKRNLGLVPGESGDYFSRLQAETEALDKARSQLRIAEGRKAELAAQMRGETTYVPVADASGGSGSGSGSNSDTTARLQEAESRLQDLLLRYTDRHPEVIALRQQISELMARQEQELAALREGKLGDAGGRSAFLNPVRQRIQMQLNETEVEIAALRGQIADHQRRSSEMRRLADTAPEVEAEFARLNRDYGVTRAQYQSLVERLEKAKLSDKADETGTFAFNIIDPPVAKLEPVAPQRGLLIFGAMFIGLLAGMATAYGLSRMNPVFESSRSLSDATGRPVIGTISLAWQAGLATERAIDLRRTAVSAGLLVMACLVLFFTDDLIARLLRQLLVRS